MTQENKTPDNSIDFEPTTIEEAAKAVAEAETPAQYAARIAAKVGNSTRFDLPQNTSYKVNITDHKADFTSVANSVLKVNEKPSKEVKDSEKATNNLVTSHEAVVKAVEQAKPPTETTARGEHAGEKVDLPQGREQDMTPEDGRDFWQKMMDEQEKMAMEKSRNTVPRSWQIESSIRPDLKIDSFDDLKPGMVVNVSIQRPNGLGEIKEALIGKTHPEDGTIDIEFDYAYRGKRDKETGDKKIYSYTDIRPMKMTSDALKALQRLNNDHNAIWFRRKIGGADTIKFKANDGKIVDASIYAFYDNDSVGIRLEKDSLLDDEDIVVSAAEVDSMNTSN